MPAFGITAHLCLAFLTVCRYLKRRGLSRKRDLFPPITPQRYERESPGDVIHIDIKKLAEIDGVGHRIHKKPKQGNGKGYEYFRVAIDNHSRHHHGSNSTPLKRCEQYLEM